MAIETMFVFVVRLFRFPASRHCVATSSRFRRVKVVARQTLCHLDEWRHHPTSLHDATITTADLEVASDPERQQMSMW